MGRNPFRESVIAAIKKVIKTEYDPAILQAYLALEYPLQECDESWAITPEGNSAVEIATAAAIYTHSTYIRDAIQQAVRRCESPIEEMMLSALITACAHSHQSIDLYIIRNAVRTPFRISFDNPLSVNRLDVVGIYPQMPVGKYRVDFLVDLRREITNSNTNQKEIFHAQLVVECDGHDYHERTKQQASSDKKRDRALQAKNMQVFRYTGSDIWSDAFTCGEEVIEHLDSLALVAQYPAG